MLLFHMLSLIKVNCTIVKIFAAQDSNRTAGTAGSAFIFFLGASLFMLFFAYNCTQWTFITVLDSVILWEQGSTWCTSYRMNR